MSEQVTKRDIQPFGPDGWKLEVVPHEGGSWAVELLDPDDDFLLVFGIGASRNEALTDASNCANDIGTALIKLKGSAPVVDSPKRGESQ